MANPQMAGVSLSFPSMPPDTPTWVLPGFLSDLNSVYEVLLLSAGAGYERAALPRDLRVRRYSLVVDEDRMRTRRVEYGSTWVMDLAVVGIDLARPIVWSAASLATLKFLPTFLQETTDLLEKLSTWRHRTRMREYEEREAAAQARKSELDAEALELDLIERRRLNSVEEGIPALSPSDQAAGGERSAQRIPGDAGSAPDDQLLRLVERARRRIPGTAQGAPETHDLPVTDLDA